MHRIGVLIFVSPQVHNSADDARIAIQVGVVGDKGIVAGVEAGRAEAQMEITGARIHKQRRVGKVIDAEDAAPVGGKRHATVGEILAAVNVVARVIAEIVIHNGIQDRAGEQGTGIGGGGITDHGAINQGAKSSRTADIAGKIAGQKAIDQGAAISAAPIAGIECCRRIANKPAIHQRAGPGPPAIVIGRIVDDDAIGGQTVGGGAIQASALAEILRGAIGQGKS